jgi:hypothetical protein
LAKKQAQASQAVVTQLVRKELEKSLAQIEFPKAPPQDIYFLPNANSAEFLMCLGLEEVVKCVQEHLNSKQLKQEKQQEKEKQEKNEPTDPTTTNAETLATKTNTIEVAYEFPLYCAQCSTDFTPVWRQDKNGIRLCEKCLKTIEKKQIKTEHNARLKQAFLKAVKDKEIFEKQIQAEQEQKLLLQQEAQKQLQQTQMQQQQQQQQQLHQQQQQQQHQQMSQPPRQQNRQSIGNSPNINSINNNIMNSTGNLSNNLQRKNSSILFIYLI